MLLILTSDQDLTADFLIVELIRRNLPYFRLNSEELTTVGFRFSLTKDTLRRELCVGLKSVDLNQVEAVWYRRAIHPGPIASITPSERFFVAGELRHLTMGLVLNPGITWVNPIDRVSVAEHKLYQLQIARQVGFRVPRTLVSRDPLELRSFAAANKAGTICKPIFHGMFVAEASRYSVYTRRVTPESFDDAESVKVCPILLQEEIPRSADVRATFIGSKCFVADIKGDSSVIDWRDPRICVHYSESDLSDEVQEGCRTMLKKLGLIYGAFDFVKTPEGDLVFLELNPTGEWAWLEDRLGFPMREAFIQIFFGRSG
jgi:glutathione synthase/RimK-type ligase-like ATP-grasp enzyme